MSTQTKPVTVKPASAFRSINVEAISTVGRTLGSRATATLPLARTGSRVYPVCAGRDVVLRDFVAGRGRRGPIQRMLVHSVEEDTDGVLVYCSDLNISGAGETADEAYDDFRASLKDVFRIYERTPVHQLSPEAQRILRSLRYLFRSHAR